MMKSRAIWALPALAALFLIAGCNGNKAVIKGELKGAADTTVVVSRLNVNKLEAVDTIRTDKNGKFTCKENIPVGRPQFYYLSYNGRNFASLVLLPKDKITITADTLGNATIEGSEETDLMNQANATFNASQKSFDSLSTLLAVAVADTDIHSLKRQMGQVYVNQKRNALREAMGHPFNISSVMVLYQQFGDLPIFADYRDGITFKSIRDSLIKVYPKSEYVAALGREITSRMGTFELQNKIRNAQQVSFPEIEQPDINAKMQKLSALEGKVIVLFFWSYSQTDHKFFNNDLKGIYSKYHDRGLEIYQVSLDIDKAEWASVVRAQKIPWISVCDGLGNYSPSVAAYNITKIPSLFLFGKDGVIKARDIFDIAKLDSSISGLL